MIRILILSIFFSFSAFSQGLINTTVSLTGNVFNQVSKLPETAVIKVTDTEGRRVGATRSNGAQNGAYFVAGLKPGQNYMVEITKKDFLTERYKLSVPNTGKYLEISHDFLIKPLKVGVKIPIAVTPFELRKSKLRFGAELYLDDWIDVFKDNPEVTVRVLCFPDSKGDANENQKITDERANAIKDFFIEKGVNASRLSTAGSKVVDPDNPPPTEKAAKGKRYVGPCYIEILKTGN
jgi:outer membrane protein OmpA-like peptidoglycan-associated protein